MTRALVKGLGIGVLAVSVLGSGLMPVQAADEPANVIKYRRNVMKAQGAHITNIAAVAKGEVSFADNVPADARALAALIKLVPGLFPDGTDSGDTRALPAIWSDRAKFDAAAKTAGEAALALAAAAESGDMTAITDALGKLGKACGDCHKPFRKEE